MAFKNQINFKQFLQIQCKEKKRIKQKHFFFEKKKKKHKFKFYLHRNYSKSCTQILRKCSIHKPFAAWKIVAGMAPKLNLI